MKITNSPEIFRKVQKQDTEQSPLSIIQDNSKIDLRFNVMPDKFVQEVLFIKEYRIWHRCIEAEFNRSYQSEMRNSPSHLIFLTALTHTQKMLYVYLCHEFSLDYDPLGSERLKLWPTKVNVKMPKMITSQENIIHRLQVVDLDRFETNIYKISITSKIDNIVSVDGEAVVYLG